MLTPEQLEAVETDAREALVLAPAGSGKTRVLAHRIRHLIVERGASPSDLMVLTFTRKAAAEMRSRLTALMREDGIGDPERFLRGMRLGTFHAVALRILRAEGDRIGYLPESLVVVDEVDAEMVLVQVARDLGHLKADGKWRGGLSMRQVRAKLESFYTTHAPVDDTPAGRIISEYWYRLKQLNALDFGMILSECETLLSEHESVRRRWQSLTKYVLVDEYQDTDLVQYTMHRRFAPPAEFFAVADRRQAIYGFRGARPDLMTEQHPDATVIDLRRCFRCGDWIVRAANALIAHNGDALALPMVGATDRSGSTSVFAGRSADVAAVVARHAKDGGFAWRDIAVLARTHRTLRRLESVLADARIPVHRVGSRFDICHTDEFRRVLAAIRLCVDERDNLSFARLRDDLGVDAETYASIRSHAAGHDAAHLGAYFNMQAPAAGRSVLADAIAQVHADIAADVHIEIGADVGVGLFLDLLGDQFGPVREFWQAECAEMTLAEALDWYALRDSQDDAAAGERVTLATVHAAKGLEWPVVLVAECNEGTFPSSKSLRDGIEGEREERRVCYVAMTRAREHLAFHYRRPQDQSKNRPVRAASRFLGEAGARDKARCDAPSAADA